MKKVRNSVLCAVLCLTMMMGSAFSSMAASGSAGSNSFKLCWNTTSTTATAVVTSSQKVKMSVNIKGDVYSGKIKLGAFSASNSGTATKLEVKATYPKCTAVKNGLATATRTVNNNVQKISTPIYFGNGDNHIL